VRLPAGHVIAEMDMPDSAASPGLREDAMLSGATLRPRTVGLAASLRY
jgi:hypothetical protein